MKTILNSNCGNSPKNKFIEDYSIDLLTKNIDKLKESSANSISIILPDGTTVDRLSALKEWNIDADTLTSLAAISHGKQASFLALLTHNKKERYVSIYYEFNSFKADKIKKIIIMEANIMNSTT